MPEQQQGLLSRFFEKALRPLGQIPTNTEREMVEGYNRMKSGGIAGLVGLVPGITRPETGNTIVGAIQIASSPFYGIERALLEDPIVETAVEFGADEGTARGATQMGLLGASLINPLMASRKFATKAGSLAEVLDKERGMVGYHGSPHDFPPTVKNPLGEFTDKAIGSGDGGQAFGYGHYIAEGKVLSCSNSILKLPIIV